MNERHSGRRSRLARIERLCDRIANGDAGAADELAACGDATRSEIRGAAVGFDQVEIVVSASAERDELARCLAALSRTVWPAAADPLVIVDRADLESCEWVRRQAGLRLHRADEDASFEALVRAAFDATAAPLLVLLDASAEPQVGWLEVLLEAADAHPEAAAIGARCLTGDSRIVSVGFTRTDGGSWTARGLGLDALAPGLGPALSVPALAGACLLVRRAAWEDDRMCSIEPGEGAAEPLGDSRPPAILLTGELRVEPNATVVVRRKTVAAAGAPSLIAAPAGSSGDVPPLPPGSKGGEADSLAGIRQAVLQQPARIAIAIPHADPWQMWGEALNAVDLREAFEWRPDVEEVRVFDYGDAHEIPGFHPDLTISWSAWRLPLRPGMGTTLFYLVNFTHEHMPAGQFLGVEDALRVDADLYAANSAELAERLSSEKPARLLHLAANPRFHRPRESDPRYRSRVGYLGSFNPGTKGEETYERYLRPALPLAPAICGEGWQASPASYRRHWRGLLPIRHGPRFCSSVDIALGFHAASQAAAGMINNRVFETLGCGAFLLSDAGEALRDVLAGGYVATAGGQDSADKIAYYLDHPEERARIAQRGRDCVLARHTYDHRAREILEMLAGQRGEHPRGPGSVEKAASGGAS